MGKIKASYVTDKGKQMLFSGGTVNYTKAVLYSQDVSNLTVSDLRQLASLTGELMTTPVGVSDKQDGSTSSVNVEATFTNAGLDHDIEFHSVGWFAKQGDNGTETLMAVQVANNGANLAAGSPNGATDAVDLTLSFAIGDTTTVTAVIDPAGSPTFTDLHNSANDIRSELHTALATKADKSDLEPLAKTADVQAGLDTKANKTAVDSDVKSINDTLATKADKQTVTDDLAKKADKTDVDTQIGTVNKSVSDLSDTVKANKDDTDKVLATKADKATVESELSTKANQSDLDKTNAEVAKKASTTDVNSQLATKADAKDVTDALALKDDTVDVDKKISNVTNSVNSLSSTVTSNKSATDTALGTKANANDVANSFEEVRNRVKKLEGQQELTDPDFNTLTSTGIYMIENPTNGKNSPSNGNWGTLVVSRGTTGSDSRILQEYYPDSGDLPYFRMSGPGGVWRDWKQLSDQSEINSLRDAVNTKADKTDVAKDIDTVNKSISSMSATITANQKATDTALDTKADKTTVNQELATKANSTDVDDKLAAKADSADVTKQIKTITDLANTKADQTALDATNATVATKANSSDVYTKKQVDDAFSSRDATIATKADKATVDAEISKIDFTPYAKTADVDSKLQGYTNTADLTKLLDVKANAVDVYSKTELDKKLLDLSTDTDGKVNADQVSSMIANKVDKSDLASDLKSINDSIATKANTTDVNTALAKKDDTTDVDAKIKTVIDLANTKADKTDVTAQFATKADKTTVESDLATKADQSSLDETNAEVAKKADSEDVTKQLAIKANVSDVDDALSKKDNTADVDAKIKTVTDLANTKANASDVYNKQAIDTAFSQRDSNLTTLQNNLQGQIDKQVNSTWAIDNNSGKFNAVIINASGNSTQSFTQPGLDLLNSQVDKINQLKGNRVVDAVDFNTLTDTGVYYVANTNNSSNKNAPVRQWGTLVVSNGNNHRLSQVYFPDDNNAPWYRTKDEGRWLGWQQLSTKSDVNNAVNLANSASNKIDAVLANSYVRKQGMNANGDCVEIKHTGIKQANGGYAFDMWSDDWTASKLQDVIKNQLPSKADKSQVNVSGNLFNRMTDDSTWKAITGVDNTDNAILTSIRDDSPSGGNTTGGNGSAIAFGGSDTKAVLSVNWLQHEAKITSGNGSGPKWVEDVAWKSDINSTNQTVSALQQTIRTLNDTLSSANATIKTLQDTITKQATTITGLQTQVSNQANEIKQLQETTIKGKTFSKSQEAAAEAWEKQNSQQIAFIRDKQ